MTDEQTQIEVPTNAEAPAPATPNVTEPQARMALYEEIKTDVADLLAKMGKLGMAGSIVKVRNAFEEAVAALRKHI